MLRLKRGSGSEKEISIPKSDISHSQLRKAAAAAAKEKEEGIQTTSGGKGFGVK